MPARSASTPATGQLVEGFEAQVDRALDNVGAVLAAAGLGFGDVVKTTCFLIDLADFQAFNEHDGRRLANRRRRVRRSRWPACRAAHAWRSRWWPIERPRSTPSRAVDTPSGKVEDAAHPMPTPPPAGAAARLAAWTSGT